MARNEKEKSDKKISDLIATDDFLTDSQRRALSLLASMIIPASAKKGLPAAGELDLEGYMKTFAGRSLPAIQSELSKLDNASNRQLGKTFASLDDSSRQGLINDLRANDARFAQNVVAQTLSCYYQNERVMAALGIPPRPPFPEGNEVVSGDLSLLDPVRQREKLYREA